jgi:RNA polymerase sigma-70 factor (ECF subfamily)
MSAATLPRQKRSEGARLGATAFIELTRPHATAVARSILGSCDEVEDVVQEALLRAYTRLDTLRDRANIIGWISKVTRTVCFNMLRDRRPSVVDPGVAALAGDEGGSVEEAVVGEMIRCELVQVLGELPGLYCEPLTLFLVHGLSYQAIADRLGAPLGTVKGRIHRGRRLLLQGDQGRLLEELMGEARPAA